MATGRSGKNLVRSPAGRNRADPRQLSDKDLYFIVRKQLNGRNRKLAHPDFPQTLAEEVMTSKIGPYKYGGRVFAGTESEDLRARAEQFELIGRRELAYRSTGGPVETLETPCACADLSGLTILGVHLSGSRLEGSDVRFNGNPWEWSDIDVMLQLGPLVGLDRHETKSPRSAQSGGVSVTQEDVGQPGFMLLHHKRLSSCRHPSPIPFSGRRIRKKLLSIVKMQALKDGNIFDWTFEGPALTSTDKATSADVVLCVGYTPWSRHEFAARRRPSGRPSAELVSRLCRTPALLVPVGAPGSVTKQHEWRLSFSRHEYLVHRSLTPLQKDCLTVLKHCNAVVNGPHGALKGFQLKTALLWLCERLDADEMDRLGFHDCLLAVLKFIEKSADRGRLDCYFNTKVNLLAGRTEEDLQKLREAVDRLRKHLAVSVRVLVAIFVRYNDSGVCDARLPSRRYEDLWKFMFPGADALRKDHVSDTGYIKLKQDYPIPGTWMMWENIGKLFSSRSPSSALYERVARKLESSRGAAHGSKARGGKEQGERW